MINNLFGLGDQIWLYIDQIGILLGVAMGITWFAGLVWAVFKPESVRRWFTRNRFPSIGGRPEHTRWQGLIFTVSRANVPIWVIEQVQPEMIGLLITDSSQSEGEAIRARSGLPRDRVVKRHIDNPDDPFEVKQKTKELIAAMQERQVDAIAVDITGGKTTMSLGAFMAAEEAAADTLYVTANYKDTQIDMSTANIIAISQAGSQS
jgi:hypothetical protein